MDNKNLKIDKIIRPFQQFISIEASGGILLLLCTVIALCWANLPISSYYFHLWHTKISLSVGEYSLNYSLQHWINDGLMAIFFFIVGLEIKREFFVGELSSAKQAALPIAAALGGMIIPALIYTIFNLGKPGESGWGIPMATDIAFVVGIMALLGRLIPLPLKIFVTALAIADDIGAVLVIAFFYTSTISINSLLFALIVVIILISLNKIGVKNLTVYSVLGLILWLAFLKSGVHATIAGVLLAFTIPVKPRFNPKQFLNKGKELIEEFNNAGELGSNLLADEERQSTVQAMEVACEKVLTPLQRFEHKLNPWVSFLIMPLFALANAGVILRGNFLNSILNPVSIGIILGLFLGKQLGIFIFTYLSVKLKIASKPPSVTWRQFYGAGILAGIGFTMSLFISNLAFTNEELLNISKIGIITASLISGIIGFLIFKINKAKPIRG